MSRLVNEIKKLEKILNETYNIKRLFPEIPIEIKFPKWVSRNGWGVFYQKNRGFKIWGPNHYTRASLVTQITPFINYTYESARDPPIRDNNGPSILTYWDMGVSDGVGVTQKQDTSLKGTALYADSGTSNRVDAQNYYQRQFVATWNAYRFAAGYTIREVGLFMKALIPGSTETISGQVFNANQIYMVARLSTSDGDFTAYNPNVSLPLTVTWIIQWTI